jgi:hypothetical protein
MCDLDVLCSPNSLLLFSSIDIDANLSKHFKCYSCVEVN